MAKIIDTNNDTTHKHEQLKAHGVEAVIRYLSTNTGHEKVVKPAEARAIAEAGLKLALVFEVWGGVGDFAHDDITAESGRRHGIFVRDYAPRVGAPDGAIVWFAIDTDCSERQYRARVKPYLAAAKEALQGKYRLGVYACGYVCGQALDEGIVDATWLTQSMGWNGSRAFRDARRWTLLQGPETKLAGLSIDSNEANSDDYGAFVPFRAATALTIPSRVQPDGPGRTPPPIDHARIDTLISDLREVTATLARLAVPAARVPTGTPGTPLPLSPIDKLLGGEALVGLKTPLAIGAYALVWILQTTQVLGTATGGTATKTGSILTALISAFGALGVTAKFDRAFQAISAISMLLRQVPPSPTRPKGDAT